MELHVQVAVKNTRGCRCVVGHRVGGGGCMHVLDWLLYIIDVCFLPSLQYARTWYGVCPAGLPGAPLVCHCQTGVLSVNVQHMHHRYVHMAVHLW